MYRLRAASGPAPMQPHGHAGSAAAELWRGWVWRSAWAESLLCVLCVWISVGISLYQPRTV